MLELSSKVLQEILSDHLTEGVEILVEFLGLTSKDEFSSVRPRVFSVRAEESEERVRVITDESLTQLSE